MDTELYRTLMDKIYTSGLSKRKFADKYKIPRGWLIDFANPTKMFRPVRTETIGLLKANLGIDPRICEKYNLIILQDRKRIKNITEESE